MSTPTRSADALGFSSQRMAQLTSLVTAAATVEGPPQGAAERREAHPQQAVRCRNCGDQERAAYELARAGLERQPAIRDSWIRPTCSRRPARRERSSRFADARPRLHAECLLRAPGASGGRPALSVPRWPGKYDRLRGEGVAPLDAMREALPPILARARTRVPATLSPNGPAWPPRTVLAWRRGIAARTIPVWPGPLLIPAPSGRLSSAASRSCKNCKPAPLAERGRYAPERTNW